MNKLGSKITKPNLFALVTLVLSTVVYQVLNWIFDKILNKLFKVHSMGPFDEIFLMPKNDRESNFVIFYKMERYDPKVMK